MSITKYTILRRKLRLNHRAATEISGVDWKAIGMGAYRMCVVGLAWVALMAVLATIDKFFDEREQLEQEVKHLRVIQSRYEGHIVHMLNGMPTKLWLSGGEETWVSKCHVFEIPLSPFDKI